MMPNAEQWAAMTSDIFRLHALYPKDPAKAFFRSDGVTPCGFHPLLSAYLFIHEESLSVESRVQGAKVLMGHDLIEDTTAELPLWLREPTILRFILGMTYAEGEDPFVLQWKRAEEVGKELIVYGFFDHVGNLMRPNGRAPERVIYRRNKTRDHLGYMEEHYPQLLINRLARGLLS